MPKKKCSRYNLLALLFSDINEEVDAHINNLSDSLEENGLAIMKGMSTGVSTLNAFEIAYAGFVAKVLDFGIDQVRIFNNRL